MGHLPVRESICQLAPRKARWKVYTHINNTNPILAPGSPERAQVEAAGVAVGEDGMEFEL
jgi:pyrroloquinoline quinone biosynthesis protein B